jgi:hypothetical protein
LLQVVGLSRQFVKRALQLVESRFQGVESRVGKSQIGQALAHLGSLTGAVKHLPGSVGFDIGKLSRRLSERLEWRDLLEFSGQLAKLLDGLPRVLRLRPQTIVIFLTPLPIAALCRVGNITQAHGGLMSFGRGPAQTFEPSAQLLGARSAEPLAKRFGTVTHSQAAWLRPCDMRSRRIGPIVAHGNFVHDFIARSQAQALEIQARLATCFGRAESFELNGKRDSIRRIRRRGVAALNLVHNVGAGNCDVVAGRDPDHE